jgi:RHS repeat-associated protein
MMVMPHLEEIAWNFKEELAKSVKQKVNPTTGTAETTYYQYDGQGQRVRKVTENFTASGGVPTKKEERIYQGGFETYRRFTANAVSFERESVSLIDMGNRFVMIETVTLNSTASPSPSEMVGARMVRYHLHNHLGSAALELDQNALVISYEEYHPFGTTSYRAKNQAIEVSERRYRYTGKERDDETGLYYHGARYYIPWLARWMSSDPIVLGDGVNTFCYCSNNPINLLDPSGKGSGDWYDVETEDPRATYKQNIVTGDVIRHEPGRLEVWKETGTPGQYVAVYTEMVFPEDTLIANQSTMPPPLEPPPPPEPDPETPTPEDDSSALETAADVVTDFIPFVGSGKDLYRGIRDGDGWGIAFGIGGLALDVFTLGSGSIVKGAAKTGAKQVAKQVIKQEAKQLIKQEAKQIIKTEAKEIIEQEAKSVLKEEVETVVKKEGKEAVEQAVKKGTPGELGTLVGTSRDQMRRAARNKIAEARKAGGKHPLDFLLDADGNFKTVTSRKHSNLIDNPDVLEMGHITSNKAGGPERIMLQTAYDNQFNNWAAEGLRKGGKDLGVFVENVAIDIGGIAVDLKSAEWWVKLGWLSEDVVKNAPRLVF